MRWRGAACAPVRSGTPQTACWWPPTATSIPSTGRCRATSATPVSCSPRPGTVAAAGAGRTLPLTARPDEVRAAVLALLADGPHRAVAAAVRARIRGTDGASRAADENEAVLTPAGARQP